MLHALQEPTGAQWSHRKECPCSLAGKTLSLFLLQAPRVQVPVPRPNLLAFWGGSKGLSHCQQPGQPAAGPAQGRPTREGGGGGGREAEDKGRRVLG